MFPRNCLYTYSYYIHFMGDIRNKPAKMVNCFISIDTRGFQPGRKSSSAQRDANYPKRLNGLLRREPNVTNSWDIRRLFALTRRSEK